MVTRFLKTIVFATMATITVVCAVVALLVLSHVVDFMLRNT